MDHEELKTIYQALTQYLSQYNELCSELDMPRLTLISDINVNQDEVHQMIEKMNSSGILSLSKKEIDKHAKKKLRTSSRNKNNYSSWK